MEVCTWTADNSSSLIPTVSQAMTIQVENTFLSCLQHFKKAETYLFSLAGIASCSFGLGIIKVKSVIIVEVTLENKVHIIVNAFKN